MPTRSVVDRPGVIHWADPVKPWAQEYTAEQERWLEVAATVEKRRHAPDVAGQTFSMCSRVRRTVR